MGQQSVEANNALLGVIFLVHVWVVMDETGVSRETPCFVLASEKPIWSGNCIIVE